MAIKSKTAFYFNEKCFWHGGGNYAGLLPVGGLVEPLAVGGLPESPDSKRRFKNLVQVTGLMDELHAGTAAPAGHDDLLRIHPQSYLSEFKTLSDVGGGELGERTPFGRGSYEIAALSAGLVKAALLDVLEGNHQNAYALSRPPGHHCEPDFPRGFCLLANIAIAIEAALAAKAAKRIAVVDWDVHHGNGTEAIFIDRADVLTISIHQENNYPLDTGGIATRGTDAGQGANMNIPLPPGCGQAAYLHAMDRLVIPALERFSPDVIIVASGFDASGVDPLSRMLLDAESFAQMTARLMDVASNICSRKLVMAHEGGYSDVHVPFCGHAVLQTMAGSTINAPDPLHPRITGQQPNAATTAFQLSLIDDMAEFFF